MLQVFSQRKVLDWQKAIILSALILSLMAGYWMLRPETLQVDIVEAQQGVVETCLNLSGEVTSRYQYTLTAPVGGQILWRLKEGASTSRAQSIATIGSLDIVSPDDGQLVEVLSPSGSYTSPGQPIGTIVDLSHLVIESLVDEIDILKLQTGQTVYWQIPGYPGMTFSSKIVSIAKTITKEPGGNRGFKTLFETPPGVTLYPGMTADGAVVLARTETVTRIPVEALWERDGSSKVYLMQNGRAVSKNIQVGARNDDYAEITSGVEPGDTLIVPRGVKVTSGQRVTPKTKV